jgi:hypothetical protein
MHDPIRGPTRAANDRSIAARSTAVRDQLIAWTRSGPRRVDASLLGVFEPRFDRAADIAGDGLQEVSRVQRDFE